MTKIYNIGIMTDEKNPILNPQAEGSNTASESRGKEVVNYTKELDELIEINEKSVINFEEETSKKDLWDTLYPVKDKEGKPKLGGKKNNVLFRMTEQERQELAENFQGADREIF